MGFLSRNDIQNTAEILVNDIKYIYIISTYINNFITNIINITFNKINITFNKINNYINQKIQ